MTKRLAALLLAKLYLITAFGFALNLHYCGHLLTSVEINAPAKSCISVSSKMKCCKDKQIEVKIKDAHQSAYFSFPGKTFIFAAPQILFDTRFSFSPQTGNWQYLNKAPPDIPHNDTPVFVKNNTFRI